jgi:hypothetical protein
VHAGSQRRVDVACAAWARAHREHRRTIVVPSTGISHDGAQVGLGAVRDPTLTVTDPIRVGWRQDLELGAAGGEHRRVRPTDGFRAHTQEW